VSLYDQRLIANIAIAFVFSVAFIVVIVSLLQTCELP
jgi:hypothetical protein